MRGREGSRRLPVRLLGAQSCLFVFFLATLSLSLGDGSFAFALCSLFLWRLYPERMQQWRSWKGGALGDGERRGWRNCVPAARVNRCRPDQYIAFFFEHLVENRALCGCSFEEGVERRRGGANHLQQTGLSLRATHMRTKSAERCPKTFHDTLRCRPREAQGFLPLSSLALFSSHKSPNLPVGKHRTTSPRGALRMQDRLVLKVSHGLRE